MRILNAELNFMRLQNAIKSAIKVPRKIDTGLVDAQQARRILDRLVGYEISPILWRKIKWGLSAGRVQSVALKMICDRENEINSFIPKEYWTIECVLYSRNNEKKTVTVKLASYKGEKIEINNKEDSDRIINDLDKGEYIVAGIKKSQKIKILCLLLQPVLFNRMHIRNSISQQRKPCLLRSNFMKV